MNTAEAISHEPAASEAAQPLRTLYEGCPICGGAGISELGTVDCTRHPLWHAGLAKTLRWMSCSGCGHQFTDSHYTEAGLTELFRKAHANQVAQGFMEDQRAIWSRVIERVLGAMPEPAAVFGEERRLWVDVGCGSGSLVMTAEEYGFQAIGLDLRQEAVERIRLLGYQAVQGDLFSLTDRHPIHVLSMADVLEHMPYPVPALRHTHRVLAPDGVLFLSCPNRESSVWRLMDRAGGGQNPFWFEIEHYHNFSRRSLMWLLEQCGFRAIRYGISERYRACMEIVAVKA